MRGVPEGRGESEYLQCKYSEMPTFHRKVGTPSDPVAPGFARIHRATSPINGGGKNFLDTLKTPAQCAGFVVYFKSLLISSISFMAWSMEEMEQISFL